VESGKGNPDSMAESYISMAEKPDTLKTLNQYQILNTIRIAGTISRTEIAAIIGHSRATVTNITAEMIADHLIYEKETEGSPKRGRNRVMLAINPDAAYVVGVKVAAFRIGCVVTDILANVKSSIVMPVRTAERPVEFVADLIEEAILHCVKEAGLALQQISGIGIGLPGLVDGREGISYWSPLFHKRSTTPIGKLIQKRFSIDTYVDNDTNTVTLSQLWVGEGKGINNFVVITIEDGLGMGIVINGELYRGSHGFAGELGHFIATPNGEPCRCGKKGCYEAYISNFGILNAVKQLCTQGVWRCNEPETLSIEDIIEKARSGDPVLEGLFKRAGQYLGSAISGIIQIFNPAKIIVTGNGTQSGDLVFGSMYDTIKKSTAEDLFPKTEVTVHPWQDMDWSLGAACLALQELYKSPFDRHMVAEKMQEVLNRPD
jgi:predicted NBD/HSP70 family sugar kinase